MSEETRRPAPKRVLSGMRPTGKLHLGNYMGALKNWVELQNATNAGGAPKYECYFFIADYHALTTDYADTSGLKENVREVALDFLAAGLDPKRCTIFVQSKVPAHAELSLLLGMITPLSWLERVPSYKDQQEQAQGEGPRDVWISGLSAADERRHPGLSGGLCARGPGPGRARRDHARDPRRFNHFYSGDDREILPEPKVLLTPSPKLPGTDGRKMSKSYGNTILLSDPEPEVRAKLKTMVTDPARIRRTDKGNPDLCPVFDLHKVFSSEETQQTVRAGCTSAGIGCIQCKGWLADAVVKELAPIQQRRQHFEAHPDEVAAILNAGAVRANARAETTMRQVRSAVGLG